MDDHLHHKGTVLAVNHGWIDVAIHAEEACVACRIQGACDVGGRDEKIISVPDNLPGVFRAGDQVIVSVSRKMGFKALFLAYIIPFFVLIGALLVLLSVVGLDEASAGLISLGVLGIYYLALWLLRKRIKNEIVFRISKLT